MEAGKKDTETLSGTAWPEKHSATDLELGVEEGTWELVMSDNCFCFCVPGHSLSATCLSVYLN